MVKSELIAAISLKLEHLPAKDVSTAIVLILDMMSESLATGQRIEIRGFGSFCLHYRPPHRAHNPRTGTKVATIAKYRPHFKPGKLLRKRVNDTFFKEKEAA